MAKSDRRVQYSKMVIKAAFFEMLDEMPYEKISITELCRRADVNRGTFYLHYVDMPALLDEVVGEVSAQLSEQMRGIFRSAESIEQGTLAIIRQMLSDRRTAQIILLGEENGCLNAFSREMVQVITQSWRERGGLSEENASLAYCYITGGVVRALRRLRDQGKAMDSGETAAFLFRMIKGGLDAALSSA